MGKNDLGKVFIQIFDAALASWVDYPPSVCIFAPICGTALVVEHNGDIYSCDHFVDPEHLLGNIMKTPLEQLVISSHQSRFGLDKSDNLCKQCIECDFKFACWGACPKHRFVEDVPGEKGLNYLGPNYKNFYNHIKWPMMIRASLFNQGRAPAEVMSILDGGHETLSNLFPYVGRND